LDWLQEYTGVQGCRFDETATRQFGGLKAIHSQTAHCSLSSGLRNKFNWQLSHHPQTAAQSTPACATMIAGNQPFDVFWHHSLLSFGPKRLRRCSSCLAETFRFLPASCSSRAAICHAAGF